MKKEKVIAYGYCGRWSDGTLGWFVSQGSLMEIARETLIKKAREALK